MLVVDPMKRITMEDIQKKPWFTVDLPSYLRPAPALLAVESKSATKAGREDSSHQGGQPVLEDTLGGSAPAASSPPRAPSPPPDPAMVSPDLGVIEPLLLETLLTKVDGLSRREVLDMLREPTTNQIKVAYQLCRDDHRKLEMASEMLRELELKDEKRKSTASGASPSETPTPDSLSRSSSTRMRSRRPSQRPITSPHALSSASPMHQLALIKRSGAITDLTHADHDDDDAPRSRRTSTASRRALDDDFKTRVNELMASVEDEALEGSDIDEQMLDESDDSDDESQASSDMSDWDEEYMSFDMVDDLDDGTEREPLQESYMRRTAQLAMLEPSMPSMQRGKPDADAARAPPASRSGRRSQWHFGIRSRSHPMEIMLVLYRTMETLGMEWTAKTKLPPIARGLDDMTSDERQQVLSALNEDIFYAQAQCVLYERVVRLDLQLYKVDAHSYLVDFRNVGYAMTPAALEKSDTAPSPTALALRRDVQCPFLYFDAVFRLIVELAGGSAG